MGFLVSETELRKTLIQLGVEKYYAIIDMNGAVKLFLPPSSIDLKSSILNKLTFDDSHRNVDEIKGILYPFIGIDVDDDLDPEIVNRFENKLILPSTYHQQLNTWYVKKTIDNHDDTRPPRVAFYSYKGGVGRSTALAITARLLANNGFKVAVIDLDLEAPGLNSLLLTKPKVAPFGVVDYLYHRPWLNEVMTKERFISQYIVKEEVLRRNKQAGQLWVMASGGLNIRNREDSVRLLFAKTDEVEISLDPHYLEKLSLIDFDIYARQDSNVFENLLNEVAKYTEADVILLDSRTGLSNVSGALLNQFSDVISLHIQDNKQNREGIELLINNLSEQVVCHKVLWCHTKVPRDYNISDDKLARFIQEALNGLRMSTTETTEDSKNFEEVSVSVFRLPYIDILEDISARKLQELIGNDFIPYQYKQLVEQIVTEFGMENRLVLTLKADQRDNIIKELKYLTEEPSADLSLYISRRFMDPDLKLFVGFPGSGKKTFAKFMKNKGLNANVIDFAQFIEGTNKPHEVLSNSIFLDWSILEASQAVCKWLLQSESIFKWFERTELDNERVQTNDLILMKEDPCFELPQEVVDAIIRLVFPKDYLRRTMMTGWMALFRLLQNREGYVLPRDIMMGTRLALKYLIQNSLRGNKFKESLNVPGNAVFPAVNFRGWSSVLIDIGSQKKTWLNRYDKRLLLLIKAYKQVLENRIYTQTTEEVDVLLEIEHKLLEGYPKIFDSKSFKLVLRLALDMGIFSYKLEGNLLRLSPVYNLINN